MSKQLEQKQNHRNGDHMGGAQQGGCEGKMGQKAEGIISLNGGYKIDGDSK